MKHKRIIRGNNTIVPGGSEILGEFATSVITDRSGRGKGNRPISNEMCVIESRIYSEEKKV